MLTWYLGLAFPVQWESVCDHIKAKAVTVMFSSHNFHSITNGGYIEPGACLCK